MNTSTYQAVSKPGWLEKLSYGSGDFGFNLYWTTISAFLLIFYTDSFGLDPKVAGTMLLATRIFDAFVDPAVGAFADRTKSRWGRFRPWLIWGAFPLAVAGVLTFTTPHLEGDLKLLYAYGTFTLLMVAYSAANIPYGALSGVLTNDPQARTQINSFRFVGGFLGGTLVTYATPVLVKQFGGANEVLGWQLTMALYGAVACLLLFNLVRQTRERVTPILDAATSPLSDMADLTRNRPWMVLFGLSLLVMVTISTRLGASAYYVKYYDGHKALLAWFTPAYLIALAVGSLMTPLLTRFVDKRRLMMILMILVGMLSILFYFIPRDQILIVFGLHVLIGLCLGPKSPLTFAMYADSADYNEHRTGRRATAMTFSAASFAQKLGGALASAVIGWVLAYMGYKANTVQTGASQTGILILMSLVPGAIALSAAALMGLYNLTDARLKDIQAELGARKESSK